MSNLEALRYDVRIRDDIRPTFLAAMRHVCNITYDESKRGIVADEELAGTHHPRDIASHEAGRLNILCPILPGYVESSVRKQLMTPAKEMMEGALETIGDFRFYVAATENRETPTSPHRSFVGVKTTERIAYKESWHLSSITMGFCVASEK